MNIFRGKLVGIQESWLEDEYQLVDITTGKIIVSGTHEQILSLYDEINAMDTIPSLDVIRKMV